MYYRSEYADYIRINYMFELFDYLMYLYQYVSVKTHQVAFGVLHFYWIYF